MDPEISVDAERLIADLVAVGRIGRIAKGGLTRTSFSAADTEARSWYFERCAEAGLVVVIDGIGNIIVSLPGLPPQVQARPAVWSGSHLDTVPNGGKFDGALGSIAALECLRRIHEGGIRVERPVCAVVYSDEEGNYAHLLGSTALTRGYSLVELESMVGRNGEHLGEALAAAGGDLMAATLTKIDAATLHSTVELHIEQGPTLETHGIHIGVVTEVVGLGGGIITFEGRADHAGTTPMNQRRDALVAGSAFIVALPDLAASIDNRAVITSGILSTEPGGANVITEFAHVTIDFRHPDASQLAILENEIQNVAHAIADQYGVTVSIDLEPRTAPVQLNENIQDLIAIAARGRGFSSTAMPSGAGHDSQNMALMAPTGMIFVPSVGGRSHCPEENTTWVDVENGANVLLDVLIRLARA